MKHLKYTYKEVVKMKPINNSDKTYTCPVCGNVSKNRSNINSCLQEHVFIRGIVEDLKPYMKTALNKIVSNSEFIKRYTNNVKVDYVYKPNKEGYDLDTIKGASDYAKALMDYEEAKLNESRQVSNRTLEFFKIDAQKKADILSICDLGDKEIHYKFVNYLFDTCLKKGLEHYADFFVTTLSFVNDMKRSGTF